MDDSELLRRYARDGSEEAFHELVRRNLNLVYSAALRQVGGDRHRAEDVTQAVFASLAAKAATVARHPSLSGWLFTSTRFAATKLIRSEQRRVNRELESHAMNTPQDSVSTSDVVQWREVCGALDNAMHELKEPDRLALIHRFFEAKPLAAVGTQLGISEGAARKRVERSLESLRLALARRGIVSTSAALATNLAEGAITTAPSGLIANTASTALATAAAGGAAKAGIAFLIMTTTQKTLIATAVAALLGTLAYENRSLARRVEDLSRDVATAEHQRVDAVRQATQNAARIAVLEAENTKANTPSRSASGARSPAPASPAPAAASASPEYTFIPLPPGTTPEQAKQQILLKNAASYDASNRPLYEEFNLAEAAQRRFLLLQLEQVERSKSRLGEAMKLVGADREAAILAVEVKAREEWKEALTAEFGPDTAVAMTNFQFALPARRLTEKISAESPLSRPQVTQVMTSIANNSRKDGNGAIDPRTINVDAILTQLGGSFSTQQIEAARKILIQERGW